MRNPCSDGGPAFLDAAVLTRYSTAVAALAVLVELLPHKRHRFLVYHYRDAWRKRHQHVLYKRLAILSMRTARETG